MDDIPTKTLAESDNYAIWTTVEDDGETIFHLELGNVTLHFFQEEWEELAGLLQVAMGDDKPSSGGNNNKKRRK